MQSMTVGRFTYGQENISVRSWGEGAKLKIGSFCSIADEVTVFLGGNHRTDWLTTYPFPAFSEDWPSAADITGHPATKGDVIIGHDVWIGSHASILSGVTIGNGAVIGAYSVVTKDVQPYEIVAGNPAKKLRSRFSDEVVRQLLELKWWEWSDRKIKKHLQDLCSTGINNRLINMDKI